MQNILYLIAIPSLSFEEFTITVVPSVILTNEKQLMLFKAITMNQFNPCSKFRLHLRKERDAVTISLSDLCQTVGQKQWGRRTVGFTATTNNMKNITMKPYNRIRVVSANINVSSHVQFGKHDRNTTITCTALGKSCDATCDYNGRCSFALAFDIPAEETRNLVFEITVGDSVKKYGNFENVEPIGESVL